jgi:transposase
VPIESGETMSRRPRRNHTPGLKAKVALAAIKGDRTLAQLAEQFDVHMG